jgi:uncharacterized protein (DUF2236 family)
MLSLEINHIKQLAHPYVAWAVHEHSYAVEDTKRRFYNTFKYVFGITFGSFDVAEDASRRVWDTHAHIVGRIPMSIGVYEQGSKYSAADEVRPDMHDAFLRCCVV